MNVTDSNAVIEEADGAESPPTLAYDDETIIWEGKPSQWVNFGAYFSWVLIVCVATLFLFAWEGAFSEEFSELANQIVIFSLKALIGIGTFSIIYAYLSVYYERTEITRNKIKESKGITSIFQQDLFAEISDITDIKSPPAGILGVVRLCNLVIETKDEDQPLITIRAIPITDREDLISVLQPIWRKLKIERKGYFGG